MPSSPNRIVSTIVLLALGFGAVASAQQESLQTLQATEGGNRRYFVRLTSGEKVSGRLLQSARDEVSLLVNGRERKIPIDEVARVDRSGDPLKNGAIIGAVIAGAWCALVCGQGLDSSGQIPLALAANAGVGALIGAGIDAAHQGRTIVYERSSTAAPRRAPQPSLSLRFSAHVPGLNPPPFRR